MKNYTRLTEWALADIVGFKAVAAQLGRMNNPKKQVVQMMEQTNRMNQAFNEWAAAPQQCGGVTLCFTAERAGEVRLLAGSDPAPQARWMLPEAREPRELLVPLKDGPQSPNGLRFETDEGITLLSWQLHPADSVVTGPGMLTGMDFPDPDIIRVEDTYYMISTTMYFMPGGVILRSYDLINWEYCSRVYDVLEDTPRQRLEEGDAYGAGMWAATLRYHKGTFYVIFVANDTRKTYLYRAENIEGPWRRSEIGGFYHDCSLLFDDDERIYLVYGNRQIHLVELDAELTAPKPGGLRHIIADSGESAYLGYEGSHLYKMNGKYYLFLIHSRKDRWRRVETCLMSDSLTGQFTGGIVMDDDIGRTDAGVAQGGIVDTPDGRWFAILFQDVGAAGRVPVLMPMAWEQGRPVLGLDGRIPPVACNLTTRPGYAYKPLWCSDDFTSLKLADPWEWNHIPRPELVQTGGGQLRIRTGQITPCLTQTRNILTQRALLPACAAEVTLDASGLREGDTAGLCVLQSRWAYAGLGREKDGWRLVMVSRRKDDGEEGVLRLSLPWDQPVIRLRAELHFSPSGDVARLYCQTPDGWQPVGDPHEMYFLLDHFTGNRFGLFVQSGLHAGGEAAFSAFRMEQLPE